jgi:hypothetical protein
MKTITLIFIGLTWSCFSQTDFAEKFDLKPKSQKDILPDNAGLLISESKSGACSNTSEGTIGLEDCSYIGTATFNTIKKFSDFDATGGLTSPSPLPTCNTSISYGSWHKFDLAAGVSQISFEYAGGYAGAGGFSDLWMAFYQGVDCSSRTIVGCGKILDNVVVQDLRVLNLDATKPLWIFTWSNKNYTIDFNIIGKPAPPVNDNCANAASASSGCNLGATGAVFSTPSTVLGAGACSGGTWYSNENTVFYSFTATSTSGSIDIDNIICNDGIVGEAQIAVWKTCAAVGTYGANYLGCAVGTGTINLPTLTVGDSYIIAVDGQAGDVCKWDFITTGVSLPIELSNFEGKALIGQNQLIWRTLSETSNDYFEIERSLDAINFTKIGKIEGFGTTTQMSEYDFIDRNLNSKIYYYRLKQYDFDGKTKYYGPISIQSNYAGIAKVVPNPVINTCSIVYEFKKDVDYKYLITDSAGKVIIEGSFSPQFNNQDLFIDVALLKEGIYCVQIENGINEQVRVKFVK